MRRIITFLGIGLAAAMVLRAQTVTSASAPLGGNAVALTGASDSLVSVPFQRSSTWVGQVASVSGTQIFAAGVPGWTPNQWVYAIGVQPNTYFVLFTSGAKAGHGYTVETNDSGSVSVELLNDDLSGVAAGDVFSLVPYWTLATLFPASAAGTAFGVTAVIGTFSTEIVMTDPHAPALNSAAINTYYFYNGAWRCTTSSPTVDQSNVIVRSDVPFRIRNPGQAFTWTIAGAVYSGVQSIALPTSTSGPVDDPVALLWPLQVSLNSLSLSAGSAFLDSTGATGRTDLLMVYDNQVVQLNRPATSYYIHYNGAWRKLGQPLTQDFGTDPISGPRYSFIIRKAATLNGTPSPWLAPTPP